MSPTVQNTKSLTEGRERLCAAVTCMLHGDWPDCTRIYASLCHTLLLEHGFLVQRFLLWLIIHICLLLRVRIFKLVVQASVPSSAPVERYEHWQKRAKRYPGGQRKVHPARTRNGFHHGGARNQGGDRTWLVLGRGYRSSSRTEIWE